MGLLDDLTMHGHDIENNPHPSDGVLVDDVFLRVIDDPELKEDSPLERYIIQRFKDVNENQIISGKMEDGETLITDDWDTCLAYYEKLVSAMDGTGAHEKAREIIAKDFEGKITIEEKDTFVDLINKCEVAGCDLDAESFVEQGRLAKVAEVEEEIRVAIKTGQDVGYRDHEPDTGLDLDDERVEEVAIQMAVEKAKSAGQESMISDGDTLEEIVNLCNNSGHAINAYELRDQAYNFVREELVEKAKAKEGEDVIEVDPADDARKMLESIQKRNATLDELAVPVDEIEDEEDEEDTEDS